MKTSHLLSRVSNNDISFLMYGLSNVLFLQIKKPFVLFEALSYGSANWTAVIKLFFFVTQQKKLPF